MKERLGLAGELKLQLDLKPVLAYENGRACFVLRQIEPDRLEYQDGGLNLVQTLRGITGGVGAELVFEYHGTVWYLIWSFRCVKLFITAHPDHMIGMIACNSNGQRDRILGGLKDIRYGMAAGNDLPDNEILLDELYPHQAHSAGRLLPVA